MSSSNAATKANRTRSARKAFTSLYGEVTSGIVRMLASGLSSDKVSEISGTPKTTVAAVKANLTRGTYRPYAFGSNGRFTGTCNYRG